MVVFGGFSEYGDVENDLAVLDMDSWKWSVPKTTGDPPCPRCVYVCLSGCLSVCLTDCLSVPKTTVDPQCPRYKCVYAYMYTNFCFLH